MADPIDGQLRAKPKGSLVDIQPAQLTTDMGNAERLAKYYGDRVHYCYERSSWLVWTGKAWEWDTGARIGAVAKATVRNIYREAGNETDDRARKELADHAKRSESDHRINAMLNLAQSEPHIPIKLSELDNDPWLLNCANGTIDLHTGQLLPHRKSDLITVLIPVEYDPNTECPRWLSFLEKVTGGDASLMEYLQRAVGYSLTGETKNQVIFLLYGLGNNGKSTFTMTIRKLLAGYAERLDAENLMVKDRKAGGRAKEGIANLKNKRYVVGSELQDGKRLDVSLVKDMTGGETIKADRKYEHEIEFMPTFKLWLYGNHKPVIADSTLSIWRRVKQIPFNTTISPSEIDLDLSSKLETELAGILAWAVRGCLDWQQHGLQEPETVITATENYRHDQDVLRDFIDERCSTEITDKVLKSELRRSYEAWCIENKADTLKQKQFKASLEERGIISARGTGNKAYWKGIRLLTDDELITQTKEVTKVTQELLLSTDSIERDNSLSKVTPVITVTESGNKSPCEENIKKFMPQAVTEVTKVTPELPLSADKTQTDAADEIMERMQSPDYPPYPKEPCRVCGSDEFWPGPGGWLCNKCHPRPEGD